MLVLEPLAGAGLGKWFGADGGVSIKARTHGSNASVGAEFSGEFNAGPATAV